MSNFRPVYMRELRAYLLTPVAYLVGLIFLLVSGVFFLMIVLEYSRYSLEIIRAGGRLHGEGLTVAESILRPSLSTMSFLALFMLPMLTMKSFSEEKKSGTIEMLFTYPLSDVDIVMGKFLASATVYLLILGLTLFYQTELAFFKPPPFREIFAGYLGLAMLGGFFISVGVFVSSLTENQIVAGAWTFGTNILFWLCGWIAGDAQSIPGRVLRYLSVFEHFENFTAGVIDSRDVFYFASFTWLFLFLTLRTLESRRWRS